MKKIKIKWFYTKVFLATGMLTLVALIFFASIAGYSSIQIYNERQLHDNLNVINQIRLEVNEKIENISSIMISIYESNNYYDGISLLYNIGNDSDEFFNDPFFKKNANIILRRVFSDSYIKNIVFLNVDKEYILVYSTFLESWEVVSKSDDLYKYFEDVILLQKNAKGNLNEFSKIFLDEEVVFSAKEFNNNINKDKAYIFIGYDGNFIDEIIKNNAYNIKGTVIIFNNSNEMIYSSNNDNLQAIKRGLDLNLYDNTKTKVNLNGDKYFITYVEDAAFKYFSILDEKSLYNDYLKVLRIIILIFFIIVFMITLVYYLAITIYGKRIKKIVKALESVGIENLDFRIEKENKNDEFDRMADKFNKMCDDLKDNIEKSYLYQIKEKTAELGELQAKINPHFLNNTLESIRQCIISDEKENAEEMISSLAMIFRNSIKKGVYISIKDELELCFLLLEMYSIRFNDIFEYNIDVPIDIRKYGIPKNILQPFIENYFKHGIDFERNDNNFSISSIEDNDYIIFLIQDNGNGISEEKLTEVNMIIEKQNESSNYHYGLANVNERIKIIFGKECGLKVQKKEKGGICILLKIKQYSLEILEEFKKIQELS